MNYNIQKNNVDYSKYVYKNNKIDTNTYIFELLLNDEEYNSKIIRCIKKCNQGKIITSDDNILYNNINNYKLSIIDANYPTESIVISEYINHNLLSNIYFDSKVYLEVNKKNELLNMNYYITL